MLSLLFSTRGRISRLQFFLITTLGIYGPLLLLAVALIAMIGVQANSVYAAGLMAANAGGLAIAFIVGFVIWVVLALWFSVTAAVKRSRDAGFGSWFRWLYVSAVLVSVIIPVLNILASLHLFVCWWILVLKSGTNEGYDVEIEAFGGRPSVPMATIDLHARAAQLRASAPAPAAVSARVRPTSAGAEARGFGRRTQPAFGKR